ncbi:glycosyltransferase [Rhizobium sp. BE258]|uniref:glycosyltransferase family 2 protein n=1 Tax=Rhizobium sp. BE258 TaxID=2817722 RepID=UPI0028650C63|nr:glycosyltransferase [Rhizobium sp. BE258]MDR7145205.1 glycosyltransferase involved in cell wall biosynthesis [Rhizobium sp. BE258]
MSKPRVSVLLPLYNCQAYVAETLHSLAGQSYEDFEIIAVNDGSTDGTAEELERFAASDPRCKVIQKENSGIVDTLNIAAAAAQGEFFARIDGDDIARHDRFLEQVRFLDQRPDCVCVGSLYRMIDEDGVAFAEQAPFKRFRQTNLDIFPPVVASPPHPSIMFRREIFELVGGYRKPFAHAEDRDLFLRFARYGSLEIIQQPLLDYRIHRNSLSTKNVTAQLDGAINAVLSAMAVNLGKDDPARAANTPTRGDFYRAIGDRDFERIFDRYVGLLSVQGEMNRRRLPQAAMQFAKFAPWVLVNIPLRVADRRFRGLLKETAKTFVKLVLRRV